MEEYVANLAKIKTYAELVEEGIVNALPIRFTCIIDPFSEQKKEIDKFMEDKKCLYEIYKNEISFSVLFYKHKIHKDIYERFRNKTMDSIQKYSFYRMVGYNDEKACKLLEV